MDERVARLRTPEECKKFGRNAIEHGRPDLALEARRRAVELQADKHSATTDVEKEALKAIYAYEELLSAKNGRTTRATRTWQMIERHGLIGAIERAVNRKDVAMGYRALAEMGMEDLAFESIVLRYPQIFTAAAVEISRSRISEWTA